MLRDEILESGYNLPPVAVDRIVATTERLIAEGKPQDESLKVAIETEILLFGFMYGYPAPVAGIG